MLAAMVSTTIKNGDSDCHDVACAAGVRIACRACCPSRRVHARHRVCRREREPRACGGIGAAGYCSARDPPPPTAGQESCSRTGEGIAGRMRPTPIAYSWGCKGRCGRQAAPGSSRTHAGPTTTTWTVSRLPRPRLSRHPAVRSGDKVAGDVYGPQRVRRDGGDPWCLNGNCTGSGLTNSTSWADAFCIGHTSRLPLLPNARRALIVRTLTTAIALSCLPAMATAGFNLAG
jgi:hypothetical protein